MPFLRMKTNLVISDDIARQVKKIMGQAIGIIPGKSEDSLFFILDDTCLIWRHGSDSEDAVYIEATAFATEDRVGYTEFSSFVATNLSEILTIPLDNIYIQYSDMPAWSVGDRLFIR